VGEGRLERHRHIHEPEIVEGDVEEEENEEPEEFSHKASRRWESSEEEEDVEEQNEDDIERRRLAARQKALIKQQEEVSKNFTCNYAVQRKIMEFILFTGTISKGRRKAN
jgi:hypothetical protein